MTPPYQLALIDNAGPNTLRAALRHRLAAGSEVRMQVAFATMAGVNTLLSALQRAANGGSVRIIVGLYQGITEPGALRLLLQAADGSSGRLRVRLSKHLQLHAKMYVITTRTRSTCVIGSSNLSRDGLFSSGELNLSINARTSAPLVQAIIRRFDEAWEMDSVDVTRDRILRYEKRRPQPQRRSLSHRDLREILGSTDRRSVSQRALPSEPLVLWREAIHGFATKRTHAVVGDETNWDRREFWWHSCPAGRFHRGHRLLVFDFTRKFPVLQIAEVRDTTHTSVSTPDGRDFVAYTTVPRCRVRQLTRSLWSKLSDIGIVTTKKQARHPRRLSAEKLPALLQLLRKP